MMSTLLKNHPMVTQEHWERFTQTEHTTWGKLFEKQSKLLREGACHEVLEGIHKLGMCHTHIPKFCDLNDLLQKETGFSIVPVTGLIPEDLFFHFLAQRKFPSTCFIRKPSQIDYLEEPDIFHDIFGHIPLLIHPVFADFMEEFGKKGLQAIKLGQGLRMKRNRGEKE
jgi:phenylalanine-4-hydroxylase